MKRFDHMELWTVFCNPEQVECSAERADAVLGEFAEELQSYCRKEKDLAERTRTLRFTRGSLAATQRGTLHGAEKKWGCHSIY